MNPYISSMSNIMKAIVCTSYGPPETLQLKEVEKPMPKENEVLVKIMATAINDYDWSMVRGKPYLYRLMFGLLKPGQAIPGMELAGIVEAVGADVISFKSGDAVYGDISAYGFGSFAEYIVIHEKALVKKPESMGFEEAASIPHAALLARQGLCDIGNIRSKQKILINGAGGGVGTFGLQLAKLLECEVTGVDTGEKLEMMKALGFDQVIDYRKEDFTRRVTSAKNRVQYDLILDCKTSRSPFSYLPSLKPHGMYVTVGGKPLRLLQVLVFAKLISFFTKKKLSILALQPNQGLAYINELYAQGKIKCIIDGPYALAEAPRLIQYFGEGKHQGKVVLKIG
ncbi:NAD(P)-dependent alcohol dehydrogenase [Catalinimonas niigatensis]|uniref:NAD(P)-dependent alcohol dehydrogenase n=1 Tax=Catalinimonas niigatensis TaxID=1397264 RepID=UPI002665461C|nr:NAD(P)-dependent alcohol dehydrogenase [Catalinimonas niigatensis]WPP52687.1 NAD(P)-dependent alcohol dehydrogenase [Catalinimonas niigatensis]